MRPHDRLGADIAARARSIVDDELLAKLFRQELGDQTRDDVGRAARRLADDDFHRSEWIGLRPRGPRHGRQHSSARGQMQKLPTAE